MVIYSSRSLFVSLVESLLKTSESINLSIRGHPDLHLILSEGYVFRKALAPHSPSLRNIDFDVRRERAQFTGLGICENKVFYQLQRRRLEAFVVGSSH